MTGEGPLDGLIGIDPFHFEIFGTAQEVFEKLKEALELHGAGRRFIPLGNFDQITGLTL